MLHGNNSEHVALHNDLPDYLDVDIKLDAHCTTCPTSYLEILEIGRLHACIILICLHNIIICTKIPDNNNPPETA